MNQQAEVHEASESRLSRRKQEFLKSLKSVEVGSELIEMTEVDERVVIEPGPVGRGRKPMREGGPTRRVEHTPQLTEVDESR